MTNSLARGDSISEVEITHVSSNGIWMLTHQEEFFLSYEDFPWFKDQRINAILDVEELQTGHFYWPEIDVDLTLEIIKHPECFPLRAKTS